MTLFCETCGKQFQADRPVGLDQYNLIRWKEENRICPECAEVGRPISSMTRKNWNPGTIDPNLADNFKIGMSNISQEEIDEAVREQKANRPKQEKGNVVYIGGGEDE